MTDPCKADFVAETMETTDAHLGIARIEELGETETIHVRIEAPHGVKTTNPLQAPVPVSMMALEVSTAPKRAVKR